MQLWYRDKDRAYSHLQATSPVGYQSRAAYALYAYGLDCLAEDDCAVAALGAAAGDPNSEDDGLLAFKRGWATDTLPVYLCGCILDAETYTHLTRMKAPKNTNYFPAYRAGELV
jgi:hypothetical protein